MALSNPGKDSGLRIYDGETALPDLYKPCKECLGSGMVRIPETDHSPYPCDRCRGRGIEPTKAGLQILDFLRKQKERYEW